MLDYKFKYYELSPEEKEKVVNEIKNVLSRYDKILLAIIFGSFIELSSFRDIDIAICTLDDDYDLNYLTKLCSEIEDKINIPVDIVPLNELDPKFKLKILTKGLIIVEKFSGIYESLLSQTFDEIKRLEITEEIERKLNSR